MLEKIKKHKNLSLFIVLVIAIGLTYVFEEKRNRDIENALNKKLSILNTDELGEIVRFQGIKLDIKKEGDKFYANDNNLILANKKLDEFFQILSGLKIKSILSDVEVKKVDRSFYIPNNDLKLSFTFKKGEMSFTLGKKQDYDQSFYMEIKRGNQSQMVIVSDESPDPNTYQNESEYKKSDFKYRRLQMMFYLTNVFFYETKLFNGFNYASDRINFKEIEIATFRNKKYKLDFEKSVTIPNIPNGLDYFDDNWISFHRILTNIEAKTIYYPYNPKILDEVLSQLNVIDRDGKKYTLEIYKKYGSLPGYFLKTSFNQILYEIRNEEAKYFFVNIQDFWQKRIYPNTKEFDIKLSFPKEVTAKKTFEELKIYDADTFKAESRSRKVKNVEVKKLIDFLKMEGDRISDVTEKQSELIGKELFKLYFANRNLSVILEDNDVVLVDFDNKIKIHHYVGELIPFGVKLSDYFEN